MKANGNGAKLLNLPRYKKDWKKICAILPAYLPDGTNGTEITYLDGTTEYIANRLCWVLDDLLGHLRSSKAILTAQSRRLLGDKARRVPLVLYPDFALVPVKGREAIGEYHAVIGYVVLRYIDKIISEEKGCWIQFQESIVIQVQERSRTVWENIQKAKAMSCETCA